MDNPYLDWWMFVGSDTSKGITGGGRREVVNGNRGHVLFRSRPILGLLFWLLSELTVRLQPRWPKESCVEIVVVAVHRWRWLWHCVE